MSEFEDNLRAILSDPAELERIGRLASELMGGGAAVQAEDASPAPGPGGDILRRFGALFGGGLDLDSLDAVELAFLVEKEFGVPVPDADAARAAFTSVGGLADFILSRRAEG